MQLEENKGKKIKTSIVIDEGLLNGFRETVYKTLRTRSQSEGIEKLIRKHLESDVAVSAETQTFEISTTPQTKTERRIVAAVLHFIRDEGSVELMPILDALLEAGRAAAPSVSENTQYGTVPSNCINLAMVKYERKQKQRAPDCPQRAEGSTPSDSGRPLSSRAKNETGATPREFWYLP